MGSVFLWGVKKNTFLKKWIRVWLAAFIKSELFCFLALRACQYWV